MRNTLALLLISFPLFIVAQEDSTDYIDYSKFGDAQGAVRYCTQKVLNQSPQRIISVGFERQGAFEMPDIPLSSMLPAMQNFSVKKVSILRAQVNIPVISTNKIIWQLGANYWGSRFSIQPPGNNLFTNALNDHSMVSAGINTTIFKPINEKKFIILQASSDVNGIFHDLKQINSNAITVSGTLIYGWKTTEKNMIGTGIARTYRAGRILHIPVLFWNRTFNDKWGMELLLPARGYIRHNFSTSNMLQAGFELEGNQFWMKQTNSPAGELYLQRGELKPRIMWDKKITGFVWLNIQAGLRYNWRFEGMNRYNAKLIQERFFMSQLGNPLYFSFSLNFVSP